MLVFLVYQLRDYDFSVSFHLTLLLLLGLHNFACLLWLLHHIIHISNFYRYYDKEVNTFLFH